MIKFLDLHAQYLSIRGDIDAAISRVIEKSGFIGGEEVAKFEAEFAAYQDAAHCVGVANGTDAIEIALEALGLPAGAEVIVPANSFIASSEAVTRSGLRVVFADVNPNTLTLDPADVARRLTSRSAAIMAVHLYGRPCDMDELSDLAERHGLVIVEDCAQAHGAIHRGRKMGAQGRIGTFSFYPGKNLGAYGDGGAITTDDAALAKRVRMIANHGRIDKYNHEFEGRNSRLDGLQAAILRAKLPHLESWIQRRNKVAAVYRQMLEDVGDLIIPNPAVEGRHAYHLFVIRTARRDDLADYLAKNGVQTGVHYPIALPDLRAYAYLPRAEHPFLASALAGQLLSLPMGEHLAEDDAVEVAILIRRFFA